MAPSKESQAQRKLFIELANAFTIAKNDFLRRCIYDQIYKLGAEAEGVTFEEVEIADRPAIWARPKNASARHAMLYMHGGGFNFGSPESHRKLTAHLAKACNIQALSVDYRLSPESRFPAQIEDCVAAYEFLLNSGFDPKAIVLAGDSCGGHLATSVPLMLIQRGLPMPAASVSLSPSYDLTKRDEGTMKSNQKSDSLNNKDFVEQIVETWIRGTGAKEDDALVSPMFASMDDIKRLPPHWISCGGHDMLCDQGTRFAERLNDAGVEVVVEVHEDQQHVMEMMAGKAPEANHSIQKIGEWVQSKLGIQHRVLE